LRNPWNQFLEEAETLDQRDELASFRGRFYAKPGQLYFDGNSLGLLSRDAERAVHQVMESWRELGIEAWTRADPPWFSLAEELGALTASMVGADPDEVVVTNSTTVNLHQLLSTFYEPNPKRPAILVDALNFPSDLYAVQSHLRLLGLDPSRCLRIVQSRDGRILDEDDIVAAMISEVQIAILPTVLYRSGQLLDFARISAAAAERGILLGLDCSHSIGVVPHSFSDLGADFAFWCGYKYLNGGPGAAAGLYLNRKHFGRNPGLAGWFGNRKDRQFEMLPELAAATGAGAMQIGTPNILSMAPLIGSLSMIREAGVERIRRKSLALTDLMIRIADSMLVSPGFKVVNPRPHNRRGGHVALAHPEAGRICRALRAAGVVPDFRPPDIVRLAPSPLYTRFADCVEALRILTNVMHSAALEDVGDEREMVT
jgi:kynureninase